MTFILFPVICCNGWQGWKWIELEKFGPTFSRFDAISTNKKKILWAALFMKHFIRYSPHSLSGTFCE